MFRCFFYFGYVDNIYFVDATETCTEKRYYFVAMVDIWTMASIMELIEKYWQMGLGNTARKEFVTLD